MGSSSPPPVVALSSAGDGSPENRKDAPLLGLGLENSKLLRRRLTDPPPCLVLFPDSGAKDTLEKTSLRPSSPATSTSDRSLSPASSPANSCSAITAVTEVPTFQSLESSKLMKRRNFLNSAVFPPTSPTSPTGPQLRAASPGSKASANAPSNCAA